MKLLLTLIFLPLFASAQNFSSHTARPQYGEIKVFVYRSKSDSIQHIQVREMLDKLTSKKPSNGKKIDSLQKINLELFDAGKLRTFFRPSRDFVNIDSITPGSDLLAVTKLTIFRKDQIPATAFACKNVEELEIIECSFTVIPASLNNLLKLKTLRIYHPKSAKAIKFNLQESIETLTIRVTDPNAIPKNFRRLKKLRILELSDNALVKFPNGARHNKNLKQLSLQRNELTLRGRIRKHKYLEQLALHDNKIVNVPPAIRKFPRLKKLNFNNNKVSEVSNGLARLHDLEQLSFYNNALTSIPPSAYALRKLIQIDLFHNKIETIDQAFVNWQRMETLYISHNHVISLPENIDALQSLTGLYAWDNRIGAIPSAVGNMRNLKYIRLNNNYIKQFPATLLNLKALEELDLSNNYMTVIPEEVFALPQLSILAIGNNPWDEETKKVIHKRATDLREKGVSVHLSDKD